MYGMQGMLRSIMRAASESSVGRDSFAEFDDVVGLRSPNSPTLVEQWHERLAAMQAMYPEEVQNSTEGRSFTYRVTSVFAEGLIVGECQAGQIKTILFVDTANSIPAGCNCIHSRGEHPCQHSYFFIDFLLRQLAYPYSELRRRLTEGRFDRQRPPAAAFRCDPQVQINQLLDDYLPKPASVIAPPADLPEVEAPTQERIAWNFHLDGGTLQVHPLIQSKKKRGDGWTKGKKVPLQRIRDHRDSFSDADQAVANLINIDHSYYNVHYSLDPGSALECLLDQPNVCLNNSPASIERLHPQIRFCSNQDSCWFGLDLAGESESVVLNSNDRLIAINRQNSTIKITRSDARQIECMLQFLRMPRLPKLAEEEVLKRAQQLQQTISIQLPEARAGKLVADNCMPALLLRSRSDGTLDYGFRVRDSFGHLHQPASGVAIRAAEDNGRAIQLVRDFEHELRLSRQTADSLGLPLAETHGSVRDFEHSMRLLDRAQSLEPELEVLWDKSSEKPIRMLGSVSSKNVQVGISQARDWFQLSGTCQFEGQSVDLSELLDSFHPNGMRGDYVRVGEHGWAKVTETLKEQLKRLSDAVSRERGKLKFDATSAPAIRDALDQDMQLKTTRAWQACMTRLRSAEQLEPRLPENLRADLRDYQQEGFCWLRRLAEWGVGGVLADDMGLGKTLQTLAVLLDRASLGPALVIAPTSVGFNWVREAEKFAPDLAAHLYRETDRADFLKDLGSGDLVVCSYGLALRDAEKLASVEWASLVLDEAQAVKNSRSKTSIAIQTFPADWKIALTGTPMENHLGELWSIFRVVSPGVFGGWEQFRKRFAAPIEKDNDEDRRIALRERLRPFVLRRTKGQVLHDLPPRTETNLVVEMSPNERQAYDRVRLSAVGELDQISKLEDVQDQRFRILALLTRLRQLACSPRLVHDNWTERSSKLNHLAETLRELHEEGHRALVFSQFVEHLKLIREMLDEEHISYEYLDGSTPAKARQEKVDRFQSGTATAFLISLKAGGTGLNLTAADYVIHMDPWWNPAVEDQATDRAHRIGQDKPVMVYRFVSKDSIEEEILKLHESKRDLVAGVLEGSSSAAKLSTQDLANLIRG